jgi:hypothetical protein
MTVALDLRTLAGTPRGPLTKPAQVLAIWRVQPGAYLVLGFASTPVPAAGAARAQSSEAARGVFRGISWDGRRATDSGQRAFLAAIRMPDDSEALADETLLFQSETNETLVLRMPHSLSDGKDFGQHLGGLCGQNAAAIARFMMEMLRPRTGLHSPQVSQRLGKMWHAFLAVAAEPDGCIEITTAVPEGCVLLQGWGAPVGGRLQVLLAGDNPVWFPGQAGEFDREDIVAPAVGMMLALPIQAAGALRGLNHVFLISDRGLHSRALVGHRLLDPVSSAGHMRHILPSLRCAPPMLSLLTETLRPRFDGLDTLSSSTQPVRAAVDRAASASDAGALLSGWVFDPESRIESLHLCGANNFSARIDDIWLRVVRPDVTAAFQNMPGFPPPAGDHVGFSVATASAPASGEGLHLRFTFAGGDRAFLPVMTTNLAEFEVRARILAEIDMFKPSGLQILEQQAAPLFSRISAALGPTATVILKGPTDRAHAIVVPLAAPVPPRAFLSGFLADAPDATEQIVLVCGPEWDARGLDTLRRLIGFQELPASILLATGTPGPLDAVREAARATTAETFLVARPAVSAPMDWRRTLRAALRDGAAYACPTLLYEDWSIRYTGSGVLRFQDMAPFTNVMIPLAGMPVNLADGDLPAGGPPGASVPVSMGTLECCAMPRGTVTTHAGPSAFATDAGNEADFFSRLKAAGKTGVWVPAVRVYAPEDGDEPGSSAPARIVDGWMLRAKWHQEKAGMK